jgi:hypothetical protein
MKKSLLSIAAVAVALCANAQAEEVFTDVESIDFDSIEEGSVIAESDNVTVKLPFADTYKSGALAGSSDPYNYIAIDGVEYKAVSGVTGSTNPTNPSLDAAAVGGCVFQFDVRADGYLVVFAKMAPNKNFYVWEGEAASNVAYSLGVNYGDSKIVFSMPADEMGYIDETAADIDTYCNVSGRATNKLQDIYGGEIDSTIKNGLGVIVFPVYADAESYLVCGAGTKMTCDGGVFLTKKPEQIALVSAENGVKDLFGTYTTGVSNISVDNTFNENAPVYNVMGQRVAKDTKGILIQNGRKFINK